MCQDSYANISLSPTFLPPNNKVKSQPQDGSYFTIKDPQEMCRAANPLPPPLHPLLSHTSPYCHPFSYSVFHNCHFFSLSFPKPHHSFSFFLHQLHCSVFLPPHHTTTLSFCLNTLPALQDSKLQRSIPLTATSSWLGNSWRYEGAEHKNSPAVSDHLV